MWFLMVLVFTTVPHQSWPIAGAPSYRACQDLKKQVVADLHALNPKRHSIKLECQK